jgi:hypothetical protein
MRRRQGASLVRLFRLLQSQLDGIGEAVRIGPALPTSVGDPSLLGLYEQ